MIWRYVLTMLFLSGALASAAPQNFESSSLKYLYQVTLDLKKGTYKGIFKRSEYGINPQRYDFTAVTLPGQRGQKGDLLLVKFSSKEVKKKGAPYSWPSDRKDVIWRLVQNHGSPKLYVPIAIRKVPSSTWNTVEVEFDAN